MSRDHRKLEAFILADRLVLNVYAVTRTFPREELFGLTSQLRRAAVSASSNIVEGCAKRSEKEFLRYLDNAMGSLREVAYQLTLAHRLGYIHAAAFAAIEAECDQACRVLGGLLAYFDSHVGES